MRADTAPTRMRIAVAALAVLLLGACTEEPQTAGTRAADTQAWNGAQPAFDAPGWKPGDKASWDEQIKRRNTNQNEYVRLAP